ncbi:hypothetical protein SAMN05216184_10337 [Georgenia satyanarayanai]|uniref:DUF4386 family protein n=1 Tax=Georgenia satyanarayanai TaxID=860221 RepID=A0A2Y9A5V3_9MICO|nr:hypothetical protein [Georgenia satyanarayanai]PYG00467.1 hypothetical protein A8987_10337 [Georgenia satyanarayanai]SSA39851.1 hypothetical protein SAMN05216184_10337 [Georgenia satyanarayanai]
MSTTVTSETSTTQPTRPAPAGRAWALSGVGAALTGAAGIWFSLAVSPPYPTDSVLTPEAVVAHYATVVPQLLGFHVTTVLAAVLLLPFAAGLHRRLTGRTPAGSLHGLVAMLGLVVLSAVLVLGSGLNTEFIFGFLTPEMLVPSDASFYSHWVATISWLWVTAGVSGLAVGVAALRHGAAGRGLGVASLALGGLTLLLGVSPLQYMAGFVGPLLLLVLAVAMLRNRS